MLVIHEGITNASKRIALHVQCSAVGAENIVIFTDEFKVQNRILQMKLRSCWNSLHSMILQNVFHGRDLRFKSYSWIGLQLQRGFKHSMHMICAFKNGFNHSKSPRILSTAKSACNYNNANTTTQDSVCSLSKMADIWCTVYALYISWHRYLVSSWSQYI